METFNFTTRCRTIIADFYTPVGIYMRLRGMHPQSVLMESSDYHGQENSHSFIGICPIAQCGLYGYTSFNAIRYTENIPIKDETKEDNDAPDVFKHVIVFDKFSNNLSIVPLGDEADIDHIIMGRYHS